MKTKAAQFFYLVLACLVTGSGLFMSFIVAPVVFSKFPKETAGEITGSLFPAYFAVQLLSPALILVILVLVLHKRILFQKMTLLFCFLLMFSGLVNYFYILPKAKAYRVDPLRKEEFRKVHGQSMILNLVAVISSLGMVCLIPNVLSGLQSGKSPLPRIKDE